MEIQFVPDQEYQLEAIAAVTDLFDGQVRHENALSFTLNGLAAIPNRLDLTPAQLLTNLAIVQGRDGLALDGKLEEIAGTI